MLRRDAWHDERLRPHTDHGSPDASRVRCSSPCQMRSSPVRTPCSDRETRGFMVCRTAAVVALLLLASSAPAGQTKGHPLITPYQGSQINGNETQTYDYEEVRIPTGKRDEKDLAKSDAAVAGKVTRIEYDNPPGRSSLEIYRNYLDAFSKGGFKILFECAGDKCGSGKGLRWLGRYGYGNPDWRYVAGKLPRAEGDVYVALFITTSTQNFIVVESKPMDTGLAKIDADALLRDLQREGHVAVYGILFDTDSASLKPDSKDALDQVAKLLEKDGS